MEQNAMALGNIVWWIITGVIIATFGIIGYFINRTLNSLDEAVKSLILAVQEMRLVMKGQEGINKEYEDSLAELWETSDIHTSDIEDVKKRVNTLETTHSFCKNNHIHSKSKSDDKQ